MSGMQEKKITFFLLSRQKIILETEKVKWIDPTTKIHKTDLLKGKEYSCIYDINC
jgi:hypothetical protein